MVEFRPVLADAGGMAGMAEVKLRWTGGRDSARPAAAFRAGDWWDYKLTPPLAMLWATTLQSGQPLLPSWLEAAALVAAIAACAAYVSLVNDHFDRDEDARSGKPNRLTRLSAAAVATLFALVGGAGLLFLWLWSDVPGAALAYLGSWIAFTLYSAPPARLKTRGLPGVLADASGASLLPCLLAVLLAAHAVGRAADPAWLAAAAAWGLGWGLRGILWHQLADLESDRLGNVHTFAARRGAETARRVSLRLAWPLELVGLAALLWQLGSPLPPLFLLLYIGVVAGRSRLWRARPSRMLLLDEYYDALLPLALVLASAATHKADLLLLAPLLLLFGRRPARVAVDAWQLASTLWYRLRAFAGAYRQARWRARASSAKPVVRASDPQ
jgi:1,4-dihydroxy-2-naphthoate octaprenyltransferase